MKYSLFLRKKKCKIFYPKNIVVADNLDGSHKTKGLNTILPDEMILDIGEKTIKNIEKIIDNSETIFWNGPAGYFENKNFANGSLRIAKKIVENNNANR